MLHTLVGIGNAAIAVPQGISKVLKKKKGKKWHAVYRTGTKNQEAVVFPFMSDDLPVVARSNRGREKVLSCFPLNR